MAPARLFLLCWKTVPLRTPYPDIDRDMHSPALSANSDSATSATQPAAAVPTPAPRALVRRLAVVIVTMTTMLILLITCVAGEFALRYRERHRDTVPGTMPLLFYRHSRMGHSLVRNANYFGWVNTNSAGFRGTREYAVPKPPGTQRVMILGSSTTFDQFVAPDERAWPARLERELRAMTGSEVEVINAGIPGHTLIDDLWRLQTELYAYQPDLLVIYEGHNDLFRAIRRGAAAPAAAAASSTPDEVTPATPWGAWLSRNSMLYAKVIGRWDAIRFRNRGGARREATAADAEARRAAARETIDRGAEKFGRDLAALLSFAQTLGLRVVVPQMVHVSGAGHLDESDPAVAQLWTNAVPFGAPGDVLLGYARFDSVARSLAPSYGATYVATSDFGLQGTQWYAAGDPIHFNPSGAERMASEMARALVANGFAGKPAN